jgi:2-haloacid dehalogenase
MTDALLFDVFGTCVDWRTSVAAEVAAALPGVDADAFADAWRGEYQPAMQRIRSGACGYVPLDDLHAENLETVAARLGVAPPPALALDRAWERLTPWPDVVSGLTALRRTHIVAPCSNGSIAMMTRLARHAGLPWDCILGADIARDYKPVAEVYRASCAALRLSPDRVTMVAAHNPDLHAARAAGLRTAFVARPAEHGSGQTTDLAPDAEWDVVATDFHDLARRLA